MCVTADCNLYIMLGSVCLTAKNIASFFWHPFANMTHPLKSRMSHFFFFCCFFFSFFFVYISSEHAHKQTHIHMHTPPMFHCTEHKALPPFRQAERKKNSLAWLQTAVTQTNKAASVQA